MKKTTTRLRGMFAQSAGSVEILVACPVAAMSAEGYERLFIRDSK